MNGTPRLPLTESAGSRPWRLLLLLLAAAAAVALGPFAGALASGDPWSLAVAATLGALAIGALLGPARLDLALLALNFAAIAFFTAIRHRSTLAEAGPHPFYEWAFLRLTLPELLALAALAARLFRRADAAAPRVTIGVVPWLFGAFFLWGLVVGLARGNTLEACLRDGRKIGYVVVAHLLVVWIAPDAARRRTLLRVVAVALFASSLATIAAWWAERGFLYKGFLRASVDVSDFLGCLGSICVPVALLRCGAPGSTAARVALVVAGGAATLCTFSRAAWCAAPLALAAVVLHPLAGSRRVGRLAALAVAAAALAAPLLFSGVAEQALHRVEALFDPAGDPSVTYRVRELRGSLAVALDHPFQGVGLGTPFDAGAALIDRRRASSTLVHHLFLWSAVKSGLPGLLLVGGAIVAIGLSLSRAARRLADPGHAGLALGLFGLLAGFVVIGQVGAMLNQARTAFLLGVVSGLARTLVADAPKVADTPKPAARDARLAPATQGRAP